MPIKHLDQIRQYNRQRVLEAIRASEPVSRTELVAITGLASGTISEIVGELVGRGMLLEDANVAPGRGRPRVGLRINHEAALAAGVFVYRDGRFEVEIVNLRGDRRGSISIKQAPSAGAEVLAEQVAAAVEEALKACGVEKQLIHSVGVSLPAVIDTEAGILHWLPPGPPRPQPLAAMIESRLQRPVFIDNTANVLARAERWFGDGRDVDDFALIAVGPGVALGQYVDGALWSGAHGMNPEFGHLKVMMEGGRPCPCGARGCLATYAGIFAIASQISERLGQGEIAPGRHMDLFREYSERARSGDYVAREVFDLAGQALGTAVASLLTVWDPAKVIISVAEESLLDLTAPAFYSALHANTLRTVRGRAAIRFKTEAEIGCARGAAAFVLERVYRLSGAKRSAAAGD